MNFNRPLLKEELSGEKSDQKTRPEKDSIEAVEKQAETENKKYEKVKTEL